MGDKVKTISDWDSKRGWPSSGALEQVKDFKSQFLHDHRVYGGTAHHPSFTTLSVTLRRGKIG